MSSVERETRSTENRLILLQWGVVAVFVFLLYGFWRLQISDPEYYSRLAEQNYIKSLPVPAPRGRILDREGRVLVDNYPSFSILAQSDYADSIEADLPAIARGLGLQPEDIIRRIQSERRKTPYGPIILLENASRENIAFIE